MYGREPIVHLERSREFCIDIPTYEAQLREKMSACRQIVADLLFASSETQKSGMTKLQPETLIYSGGYYVVKYYIHEKIQ